MYEPSAPAAPAHPLEALVLVAPLDVPASSRVAAAVGAAAGEGLVGGAVAAMPVKTKEGWKSGRQIKNQGTVLRATHTRPALYEQLKRCLDETE